ncbi:MAG: hypothetical protein H6559_14550 [Lewinellaceae bacterium]|nr:hypothetical protein [Lewinellaceae bacterium]
MPTIALIEPHDHAEVLYPLCELLLRQPDTKLCIFSQAYVHAHAPAAVCEAAGVAWFTFEAKDRAAFFRRQREQLNACRLILWVTALPPYGWMLELELKPPVVLVIHNRNNWFAPLRHLSLAAGTPAAFTKDFARLLRWLLFRRRQQRLLLQQVAAVGYGGRRILAEALDKGHVPPSGKALWVPFSYRKHLPVASSEAVKVVIPGVVTNNGRDYALVARALAGARARFRRPVHLVLLGKANPVKGLAELRRLECDRFRLTTFAQWLSQEEYAAHMLAADFLILPFREWHKVGFVREYWGHTGISGAVSDMVYYGLPALCSAFHPLEGDLEGWVERYRNEEQLADLLVQWVNEERFLEARKGIGNYEGDLEMEKASARLAEQLFELMKR